MEDKTHRQRNALQEFHEENPEYNLNSSPEKQEWFKGLTKTQQKEWIDKANKAQAEWIKQNKPAIHHVNLERECVIDLAANKRRASTEKAVSIIQAENHIYSLREDKNPEMWIYKQGIYEPNAQAHIEERVRKIYEEAYTTTLCNEIIAKIRAETYIDKETFFDSEPVNEIVVENGVINLETLELQPHSPDTIHFTRLPVTFEPGVDCPSIKQHLKTVIKNDEDLPVLQEIFGWFLWKEYKPEKAVMLLGSGRNGKGKTIELMKRFLGSKNVAGVPLQDLDERPFSIAELHKKLANIGADLPKNSLGETGRFKNLTGGDYVTADRKHQSMIHFTNYAKMVYAANKLPLTYDVSHAFFARWIIIDFPYKFYPKEEITSLEASEKEFAKERDVDIIDKLATDEELTGLLNWALEGMKRLRDNGGFSYSKNTEEVTNMWIRRSDSFAAFCQDHIREEWEGYVAKATLKREYSLYCRLHKVEMVSDKMIKRYLAETYGASDERPSIDGERVVVWKGITLYEPVKGVNPVNGFSLNREKSKSDIGVKPLDCLDTLDGTLDVVSVENAETLDMDSLFSDMLLHPDDNEGFLREKYGDKKIDYWEETGEIFRPKPGTYKRLR